MYTTEYIQSTPRVHPSLSCMVFRLLWCKIISAVYAASRLLTTSNAGFDLWSPLPRPAPCQEPNRVGLLSRDRIVVFAISPSPHSQLPFRAPARAGLMPAAWWWWRRASEPMDRGLEWEPPIPTRSVTTSAYTNTWCHV